MAKKVAVLAVNPVNGCGLFQYLEAFLLFKSTGHSFKRNDLLHTEKCIVSFKGTRFSINRLR